MNERFYSIIGRVSEYLPSDFIKKVTAYCNANEFNGYIYLGCPFGANAVDEKSFTADELLVTK